MKKHVITFLICILTPYFYSFGMLTYEVSMDVISPNKIERFPGHMVTEVQQYVNGGIFFNYPASLFTTTPIITITISAAPHASNITYTAEVCLENSTTAEVMVYKNVSGVITEAATSEVTIHFIAIGI